MGNKSSSSNTGNREVEIEIFNRFSRIAKEKFSSLAISSSAQNNGANDHNLKRLDELYKRPEFDAELRVLEEMNNLGLRGGIMCGLACFAVLRMGPGMISRMALQRSRGGGTSGGYSPFQKSSYNGGSAGGYKFDPTPPTAFSASTSGAEFKSRKPGLFFRIVRLTVDAFVSLSVGAYASVYFTDTEKMMKQFSDIPLLPGRSILSEELCDEFTNEFRKFDRRVWDEKNRHVGDVGVGGGPVDFRSTIQTFVTNCRRRHLYEEELRKEGGQGGGGMMSDYSGDYPNDEPVIIPPPGVPSDIFVSLDDILGEVDQSDKVLDKNGMADFDTYFDDARDDERNQ
ncbi:hypothetical protein ACHAWU_005309 [Discostella pseudostelligera]|uniref:Uncharacterized protein n=1 Tax=Discostella pseudostelligera TaxID=259834 RepID=A0ABD3N890_9STRA